MPCGCSHPLCFVPALLLTADGSCAHFQFQPHSAIPIGRTVTIPKPKPPHCELAKCHPGPQTQTGKAVPWLSETRYCGGRQCCNNRWPCDSARPPAGNDRCTNTAVDNVRRLHRTSSWATPAKDPPQKRSR